MQSITGIVYSHMVYNGVDCFMWSQLPSSQHLQLAPVQVAALSVCLPLSVRCWEDYVEASLMQHTVQQALTTIVLP